MKKIIFVITITLLSYSAFSQNTQNMLNSYLTVKNSLVNGNSKEVSDALIVFQKDIKSEGQFTEKNKLLNAVDKMVKEDNIKGQRNAFNDVSVNMWEVVKRSDKLNQSTYYQYCPMKKAYWISAESAIKNPYYGSSMLTCGRTVESKK